RTLDAIETAQEGISILDEDGHFTYVNRAYADLYGYDPGELTGEHWSLLYCEEDAVWVREEVLPEVEQTGSWEGTTVGLRADGDTFLEEHVVARTDHGEYVCTVRDATERETQRRKLRDLQDEVQRLIRARDQERVARVAVEIARDVLDLPLAGVHLTDEQREALEPVAVTQEVRDHLGGDPTYRRTNPSRSVDSFNWEVFESGEPQLMEDAREHDAIRTEETPTRSGIVHPLGDHGVFVTTAPEPNAFTKSDANLVEILATVVTAALDRVERETELREKTRLLERKTERLDQLASVVSHDLRTPLSVATARLEMATEECDSPHLEVVERSHERMETLLEDLLTLAREDAVRLDREHVDLDELVERSWGTVDTGDCVLRVETDQSVCADPSRLKQLFENLFQNAVEHGSEETPDGDSDGSPEDDDTEVTVTVGELSDGFYLEDDGPGIPPDERDEVFEAGYTRARDGTGLGLNIVEMVVEAHDWEIGIDEGTEGGARFEITGVDSIPEPES
ncbi:MAG: PAS domain-containing sensor histidine kinase, partial [Haloferacaceae archaeon]